MLAIPFAIDAWWGHSKTFVEHSIGFSHDALHVLVGPVIQLIVAAVLRTTVRSPWPWLAVLLLELANEWHDLRAEHWPDPQMQYGEGVKDLLLTMALPTVLLLLVRYAPGLFGTTNAGRDDEGVS